MFPDFGAILKWEKRQTNLTRPLQTFNYTMSNEVGQWLSGHKAPMGSVAAEFPSNFGQMCKT
eukprot:115564-Rhodomonas_salina.1